jgi:primosomal protein N' (replication factor Y)
VPPTLAYRLGVGARVRVPLHGRGVAGWVLETDPPQPQERRLLPVVAWRGHGPAPELVSLSEWAAWRWAGRRGVFLGTGSPPRFVTDLPPAPVPGLPPGLESTDEISALVGAALSRPRSVVILPPAADRWPVVASFLTLASPRAAVGSWLILCPSQEEAGRLTGRLRRRGIPVALYPQDWAQAASGGQVVVGSRAAAWAPAPGLRAVLVLDAHQEVYREERSPTWSAVDVLSERARRLGVPCVLTSPCPTVEMVEWGEAASLSRPRQRAGWPTVEVVDRTAEDPRAGLVSPRLVDLLRSGMGEPGRPVLCVLNRKGRARLLACRACGTLVRCQHCPAAMVLLRGSDELSCPRCGATRPALCLSCGAIRLSLLRLGVTRLAEELSALALAPVVEVSGDTDVGAQGASLAVGTEAALHRLRAAAAVAFLDFDQELAAPRFRAAEQALALLARAGRLVGSRGRVVVQTRLGGHDVLRAAAAADPLLATGADGVSRRALGLPPFSALALVEGGEAAEAVRALSGSRVKAAPLGPDRWLLRAPNHAWLCDALAELRQKTPLPRIEVDPLRV